MGSPSGLPSSLLFLSKGNMYRAILYDTIESQIFNDQFEVPGLDFLPAMSAETLRIMTDIAFDTLAKGVANEDIAPNPLIGMMGNSIVGMCPSTSAKRCEVAAKLGTFFLFCFSLVGLIEIEIEDNEAKFTYIDHLNILNMWNEAEKRVAIKPTRHPTELNPRKMVKKGSVRPTVEECPIVFDVMDKMLKKGWQVNTNVLAVALKHFKADSKVFTEYYKSANPVARQSKKRLCEVILDTAIEFQSGPFYHRYFLDFRSRLYCMSGFLHEQSTDLAKGLILLAEGKPLGEHGEKWIRHSLASNWAGATKYGLKSDKISLAQRTQWADENLGKFLNYANNPGEFTGWMDADSPWQFLAACIELALVEQWKALGNNAEDFISHLVVYIDGTCNGSQHLAAMTRDENTAAHVNLRADLPIGDLYKYIAEFVWDKIATMETDNEEELNQVIETVLASRRKLLHTEREHSHAIYEEIKKYREANKELIKAAAPVFWRRITDPGHRRKIVKRGTMTMVYGVTKHGAGDQVIEDAPKHGIPELEGMEPLWAIWMGSMVYDTMFESMPTSTALLRVFESAGKRIGSVNKSLSWRTPIVNFLVVQDYRVGTLVKAKAHYYGEQLLIPIRDYSELNESPSKQKAGASPNVVHSLDATHLMLTVHHCKEQVVTVHDSFGALAGGMDQLYKDARSTFVMLYYNNPLQSLLKQLGVEDKEVKVGNFDILEVAQAEYCFI
jgi:hypothetical protein